MPNKKITRLLRRFAYLFPAGFVFQTKQAADYFPLRIRNKGCILPNPLDLSNIPEAYTGERRKVVVGTGRLFEQKNFKLLMDAFAEFYSTHKDYSLVIYGEGYMRKELEAYAKANLPDGSWSMPGKNTSWLSSARDCSMFVLSSDFEGMPNALMEALATGIPSISTDCPAGGSAELIENRQNGILVPVGDKDAIAQAMVKIADNDDFAQSLADKALEVREKLNSENICKKWIDYIEEKIKNKK